MEELGDSLEEWRTAVEEEVWAEAMASDPLGQLYIRHFVSRSKGKGKRRRAREVTLVGWGKRKCIQVKDDGRNGLDRLAEATLEGVIDSSDALKIFLEMIRERTVKEMKP